MKKRKSFLILFTLLIFLVGCQGTPNNKNNNSNVPDYVSGEILTIDTMLSKLQIKNQGEYQYTAKTKVLQVIGENIVAKSLDDIFVGMENAIFYLDDDDNGKLSLIIIDGTISYSKVRVAIRNSINNIADDSTLYHDSVSFVPNEDILVKIYDNTKSIEVKALDEIVVNNNLGIIEVFVNDSLLFSTNKRIVLDQGDTIFDSIKVTSINRSMGNPSYEGDLEVSLANGRLLLINDINLEKYLKKVVTSEMPSSFHLEALKAQSIAARTYAVGDLLNKSNEEYGYYLDDSTSSQVYNNQKESNKINNAIIETKGLVMKYNGELIKANYYSTSAGISASSNEVWFDTLGEVNIPYLKGVTFATNDNGEIIDLNKQNENEMLTFFKTINIDSPDSLSSFHRWKVEFSFEELRTSLNNNLADRYNANINKVKTYVNGSWVSKGIPSDIGEIQNVSVDERGESGIVLSLVVETDKAKFKIISQFNIRFSIRPYKSSVGHDMTLYTASLVNNENYTYNGSRTNFSILPSAFFSVEQTTRSVVFYGGGFGHGVGMSQYGAYGLANEGLDVEEILKTYYSNIEIVSLNQLSSVEKTPEEMYDFVNKYLEE